MFNAIKRENKDFSLYKELEKVPTAGTIAFCGRMMEFLVSFECGGRLANDIFM